MFNVIIYGAGSIGNHLAYACRNKGWNVLMCDIDWQALERTKNDIYPSRYQSWDEEIRLSLLEQVPDIAYDIAFIGTPPDSHIPIAIDILKKTPPRVLIIEKPLCTPSLDDCLKLWELSNATGIFVGVGYNHTLTQQTKRAEQVLKSDLFQNSLTIHAKFREHWGGIFTAHPWLEGPWDSYLGSWEKGGGACCEHSHAINIWQHFAHLLKMGKIVEVSAMLDITTDRGAVYDRVCQLNVKTDKNLVGAIAQDVITDPAQKSLRIQSEHGFLEWYVNWDANNDALRYGNGFSDISEELFPKSRPDDFKGEIDHIENVLNGKADDSPISLERGIETMMVIAAAYKSHIANRTVKIDYAAGYRSEAIQTI